MSKLPKACNLEFMREDDFVEYYVFPQLPDNLTADDQQQLNGLLQYLESFRLQCMAIVERNVKQREYIWHKDVFQLQIRTGSKQERLLDDEHVGEALLLPPHLHGVTHFGDNIADEWFIVHLLFELTHELPQCIGRVVDADGEFLLIEAADVLPKWANPDTCEQRVYIFDGHLQLVQNSPSNTSTVLSVATALAKIRRNPTLHRVSNDIQKCINERLREFRDPEFPAGNTSIHRQIVRLPLGVAALLKHSPSLIAPAVRAFCERDTLDMKVCRAMRFFPPEHRVRTNVRFTRCLYAMIMHSNYVPDRKVGWNLSGAPNTEAYKEDLLGIKIACGFEILASQAKEACEENNSTWRAYVKSLTAKGYFRGNIEGSQQYQQLYKEAREYYTKNNERFRTAPLVGREILNLLNDIEINAQQFREEELNNLQPSDSDDWLNITADQLDAMLTERFGVRKLYKSNGDLNAEEFTKNLADFLEKQSEFDGIDEGKGSDDADVDDDDSSDEPSCSAKQQERSRSNLKKNRSMRKACNENPVIKKLQSQKSTSSPSPSPSDNFPTHVKSFLDFVIPEDNWDSNSEMSDYEDEDDLERNIEEMTNPEMNIDTDIKAYMAEMDKELANTTIGQSFEKQRNDPKRTSHGNTEMEDDFDDIESFQPININVNTLKNMMDSYKSQVGGPGPVTNLLSAMGVGMSNATEDEKELRESAV